jgi:hypothetical protein
MPLQYGMPEPAVGDKYALFFGDSTMLEETYAIQGAFMGKYFIGDGPADGDSGDRSVSRYIPETEPYFYGANPNLDDATTLSEVIASVAEHSN